MTDQIHAAIAEVEEAINGRPKLPQPDRVAVAIVAVARTRQALHVAEHEFHLAQLELIRAEDEVRTQRAMAEVNRV